MRIYCWSYSSYEAVPQEYACHTLQFDEDTPNGEMVVCGYCGEYFELTDGMQECPLCSKDLIFPRADW
jgi:rubrerythrin